MFSKTLGALTLTFLLLQTATPASADTSCGIQKTKGYTCNTYGNSGVATKPATAIKMIPEISFDQCVQLLRKSSKAVGAVYGSDYGAEEDPACYLFAKTAKQQGYKADVSSGYTFFDKACIRCVGCKLDFQNGGFETGSLSPWEPYVYDDGSGPDVSSTAHTGRYSANLSTIVYVDQGPSPSEGMTQWFPACVGHNYTLSFFYKSDAAYSTGQQLYFSFSAGKGLYKRPVDFTGQWTYFSQLFTADRDPTYVAFDLESFDNTSSRYILIDDVTKLSSGSQARIYRQNDIRMALDRPSHYGDHLIHLSSAGIFKYGAGTWGFYVSWKGFAGCDERSRGCFQDS